MNNQEWFESWATANGWDVNGYDPEIGYNDDRTQNLWEAVSAAFDEAATREREMQKQIDILDAALKAKFRLDTRHPLMEGLAGLSCDNGTLLATVLEQKGENDMLLELLREAQDVVCRNRCQFQSKLGTHVEHCDLCQRISEVLAGKGPNDER